MTQAKKRTFNPYPGELVGVKNKPLVKKEQSNLQT
jgi:hypothetical protein